MGGGCVAKEWKEIESVTESGTEFEITFIFLINKNVSKLQIILKLRKKVKSKKGKEKLIYSGKKSRTL